MRLCTGLCGLVCLSVQNYFVILSIISTWIGVSNPGFWTPWDCFEHVKVTFFYTFLWGGVYVYRVYIFNRYIYTQIVSTYVYVGIYILYVCMYVHTYKYLKENKTNLEFQKVTQSLENINWFSVFKFSVATVGEIG